MLAAKVARGLVHRPRDTATAVRERLGRVTSGGRRDGDGGPFQGFDLPGALAIGARYAPRRSDVVLDLFVSERDAIWYGRSMGWKQTHSGPLRVHPVAGPHPVLLNAGNAIALANEIVASLDTVR
jgi:hypothetical protein